jgi:transcriptional regulator with XRE-family HTH domain
MSRHHFALSDGFSSVVKQHREARGLSRSALAEKSGLHQTYIGLLEKGQRSPNLDTANAIARALQIPLSRLIAEAEAIPKHFVRHG